MPIPSLGEFDADLLSRSLSVVNFHFVNHMKLIIVIYMSCLVTNFLIFQKL